MSAPGALTVLVVEDHPPAAEALGMYLTAQGHRVIVCATGRDALAALEQAVPDLALIDLGLPDVDGAVVAARLRQRGGERTRCFAVTGRPFLDFETAVLFDGFFAKPLDVRALAQVIDACATVSSPDPDQRVSMPATAVAPQFSRPPEVEHRPGGDRV